MYIMINIGPNLLIKNFQSSRQGTDFSILPDIRLNVSHWWRRPSWISCWAHFCSQHKSLIRSEMWDWDVGCRTGGGFLSCLTDDNWQLLHVSNSAIYFQSAALQKELFKMEERDQNYFSIYLLVSSCSHPVRLSSGEM